jgi:hypothetical protein
MVVIETTSQIMEMEGHGVAGARQNNTSSHFNNGEYLSVFFVHLSYNFSESKKGSENTMNLVHRLLIFPSECSNLHANGLPNTAVIHEGYKRLKPLLYPCTIEFSLMCLTVSFPCF